MKKYLVLITLLLITSCSSAPQEEIRAFVKENVAECDGKVVGLIIVREGILSNKFVGYAEVKIGDKTYQPDILVYSDFSGTSFYKLETNPCKLAELDNVVGKAQKDLEELRNVFN